MNCPKCTPCELASSQVQGVEVDQCPECGGIWCDPAELPRLLSVDVRAAKPLLSGRADPGADARAGACPRDGTRMLRVVSARKRTVIVETCPLCRGIWLDGGELKRLMAP